MSGVPAIRVEGRPPIVADAAVAEPRRGSLASRLYGWGAADAPYAGASRSNPDLADYNPYDYSPQQARALSAADLDARVHDMARNDGWASSSVRTWVDSVIGSGWRLTAKPDPIALGLAPEQCDELALNIETEWRLYSQDEEQYDVGERNNAGMQLALGFRHRMTDGEAIAASLWMDRGGDYCTCTEVIHPARLQNPYQRPDTLYQRQGIDLGANGEAVAYNFRCAHPGDVGIVNPDWFRWERVAKRLPNGRRQIVHAYEAAEAGQVRGVSPLAPVLQKLHMLGRYDKAELQAAVINAVLAAVVTSTDQTQAMKALQGGGDGLGGDDNDMSGLQAARVDFYGKVPLRIPHAQVSYMYPTDKLDLTKPQHPNSGFEQFYRTGLRNVSAATGLTYEQLSTDWSQSNYSSARGALLGVYMGFNARKDNYCHQFQGPIYENWLEEAIARGRVKLPKGAPPFRERRKAYTNATWIGPARGWVDPKKEAEAALLRIDGGFSTLEKECADQGVWWLDMLNQRRRERDAMIKLGLDPDLLLRSKAPSGTQPGPAAPPAPPAGPSKPDDGEGEGE